MGDNVICVKYDVLPKTIIQQGKPPVYKNYLDTTWFNREAIITKVYKEYMESTIGTGFPDKNEYEITFIDDGNSLAWVTDEELINNSRQADFGLNSTIVFIKEPT